MLTGREFLGEAEAAGFDAFTGVPCSFLTPLLNALLNAGGRPSGGSVLATHVGASSEGEAIGIAAGMWLVGRRPAVLAQNSGLGNMVNPITSLLIPLRVPVLLVVTWRGEPGRRDEPQHMVMGQITFPLLELLGMPAERVPATSSALGAVLRSAARRGDESRMASALVLSDGVVSPEPLVVDPPAEPVAGLLIRDLRDGRRPSRAEVIRVIVDSTPADAALIATTGKCARELCTIADTPRNLYVVGSMGCASAVGLGVALGTRRPVVVLDGDGAALMKLGNLATIGRSSPPSLLHVVLDNGVHDSTGGQPTAGAGGVDFAAVAHACGYRAAFSLDSVAGLVEALREALAGTGPTLLHVRIAPGSLPNLGRPTVPPDDVAMRFREFLRPSAVGPVSPGHA